MGMDDVKLAVVSIATSYSAVKLLFMFLPITSGVICGAANTKALFSLNGDKPWEVWFARCAGLPPLLTLVATAQQVLGDASVTFMFLVLIFALCVNLLFGRGLGQRLLRRKTGGERASGKRSPRRSPEMIMSSLEMVLTSAALLTFVIAATLWVSRPANAQSSPIWKSLPDFRSTYYMFCVLMNYGALRAFTSVVICDMGLAMRCRSEGLDKTVDNDRILRNVTELTLRDFMVLYRLAPSVSTDAMTKENLVPPAQDLRSSAPGRVMNENQRGPVPLTVPRGQLMVPQQLSGHG